MMRSTDDRRIPDALKFQVLAHLHRGHQQDDVKIIFSLRGVHGNAAH